MTNHKFEHLQEGDVVLDALPDELAASLEVRDAWFDRLPREGTGLEFFVSDLQRWTPGQKVRVAFLGGSSELHGAIAKSVEQITDSCNIQLDFGDGGTGDFRTWSEDDEEYRADIRVSFDQGGYWSLVGNDSVDPTIGHPSMKSGGRAGQRSLNLGGFHMKKPHNWEGVVRHEFLHALAFKHSHQNMRGPCEDQFRWEDDLAYEPTIDEMGRFIPDASGRRAGIYTYLAGFPNNWTREKVDHNLRTKESGETVAGPFDPESVMLYRFDSLFYKSEQSDCIPTGDGLSLSQGDKRGLKLLYPSMAPELDAFASRRNALLEVIQPAAEVETGLESSPAVSASGIASHAAKTLSDSLSQM